MNVNLKFDQRTWHGRSSAVLLGLLFATSSVGAESPVFCSEAADQTFLADLATLTLGRESCTNLTQDRQACDRLARWSSRTPDISVSGMGANSTEVAAAEAVARKFSDDFTVASGLESKVSSGIEGIGNVPIFFVTPTFDELLRDKGWFAPINTYNLFIETDGWDCYSKVYFADGDIVGAPIFIKVGLPIEEMQQCLLAELIRTTGLLAEPTKDVKLFDAYPPINSGDLPALSPEHTAMINLIYQVPRDTDMTLDVLELFVESACGA
jgi:hypothetical protein